MYVGARRPGQAHGARATPHRSKGRRSGAHRELCTHNSKATRRNLRVVPTTLQIGDCQAHKHDNLDRGPLTTPKLLPACRATAVPAKHHLPLKQLFRKQQLFRRQQLSPLKAMGPTLRALCTRDHQSPCTPNIVGSGTTTTPKAPLAARSCHCGRSETAVPSETRGPVTLNAVRSQPQARGGTV